MNDFEHEIAILTEQHVLGEATWNDFTGIDAVDKVVESGVQEDQTPPMAYAILRLDTGEERVVGYPATQQPA